MEGDGAGQFIMYKLVLGLVGFGWLLYRRDILWGDYYARFLGIWLMLCLQSLLLIIWAISKVRKLMGEYHFRIRLAHGEVDNDVNKLNWKVAPKTQFFMNKYTEEGKLARRHTQFKERFETGSKQGRRVVDSDYPPENLSAHSDENKRLLQTLERFRNTMHDFNSCPGELGHHLAQLGRNEQIHFIQVEEHHPCDIDLLELTDNEQQLFRNNRVNGGGLVAGLPSWRRVVDFFNEMGMSTEEYLREMEESNTKFINLSYQKIDEENQMVCSQITSLEKEVEEVKRMIRDLNEEEHRTTKAQQYEQLQPDTAEAHEKWLYWLKKRYFEFVNLEQAIKHNESKLKVMKQKIKHYRNNLGNLTKKHKLLYFRVLKTSLRGFLDSIYNSIQKSIELFNRTLSSEHTFTEWQRTKVDQLKISSNVQEMIEAETKYQNQYMERVDIHLEEAEVIQKGIQDMGFFLDSLSKTYLKYSSRITQLMEHYKHDSDMPAKIHLRIFQTFNQTSLKFISELQNFKKVNQKFMEINIHQVRMLVSKITRYKEMAEYELEEIAKESEGENVIYKYRMVQERLLAYYECLEEHIYYLMDFRRIYLKHTNRLKKTLLLFVFEKLMDQKKVVHGIITSVDSKNFQRQLSTAEVDFTNHDTNMEEEIKEEQQSELDEDNSFMNDETPVSSQMLSGLNKFFFAAYTEWSVSHFFKTNIYESLYEAMNGESTEDFTEFNIRSVDFSGPAPRINSLKELKSEEGECLLEFNLSFYGSVNLEINTSYRIFQTLLPLSVKAHLTDMNITVRVCFVSATIGSGWFSFIGQPVTRIDVIPVIGNITIDYAAVRRLIQNFVLGMLKKNVYPMKSTLRVPLYGELDSKVKSSK